jgi:hypothetical protein
MAGSKNSGNPYSIPINLDKELGVAVFSLIDSSGYGKSTFIIKELMENHERALIKFWNKQGKDGKEIYEKWYAKWSMTEAEQTKQKKSKEQEALEGRKKAYLALGCQEEEATNLAEAFVDKDPCEVIKIRSYANQTGLGVSKAQVKADEPADDKRCQELGLQIDELKGKLLRYDMAFERDPIRKTEQLLKERNAIANQIANLKEEYNKIADKHHWLRVE